MATTEQDTLFANTTSADIDARIEALIDAGAVFYSSSSGGKDSDCMHIKLQERIPRDQLVVVHANLGEVEWPGVIDHIKQTAGMPVNVVSAPKTFMQMVLRRGMWPSPRNRQCTSDLKKNPIEKFIKADLKARGKTIGVNCTGLRAQESANRAKREAFSVNTSLTLASGARTVYDWLPVFDMTTDEVFETIYAAGQKPFWAYGERGELNDRLSCQICIMGSQKDCAHAAKVNPHLYALYVATEKVIGHTIFVKSKQKDGVRTAIPVPLEDRVGVAADPDLVTQLIPVVQLEYEKEQAVQAEITKNRMSKGAQNSAQHDLFAA